LRLGQQRRVQELHDRNDGAEDRDDLGVEPIARREVGLEFPAREKLLVAQIVAGGMFGGVTPRDARQLLAIERSDGMAERRSGDDAVQGAMAGRNTRADRAKALGVAPMARVVAQATSGLAPKMLLMTPVEATRKVLKKAGWSMNDVDLLELNEAFAVQAVAVMRELGVDPARVNVNGGAVALGHAIGSSGARVLTTLLYALKARGGKRGVATLCLGGGNGVALAVEMI
jgi:acetyl-CoA C-acetyltransferase